MYADRLGQERSSSSSSSIISSSPRLAASPRRWAFGVVRSWQAEDGDYGDEHTRTCSRKRRVVWGALICLSPWRSRAPTAFSRERPSLLWFSTSLSGAPLFFDCAQIPGCRSAAAAAAAAASAAALAWKPPHGAGRGAWCAAGGPKTATTATSALVRVVGSAGWCGVLCSACRLGARGPNCLFQGAPVAPLFFYFA